MGIHHIIAVFQINLSQFDTEQADSPAFDITIISQSSLKRSPELELITLPGKILPQNWTCGTKKKNPWKLKKGSKAKVTVTKHIHKKEKNQLQLFTSICKTVSHALNCSFYLSQYKPQNRACIPKPQQWRWSLCVWLECIFPSNSCYLNCMPPVVSL